MDSKVTIVKGDEDFMDSWESSFSPIPDVDGMLKDDAKRTLIEWAMREHEHKIDDQLSVEEVHAECLKFIPPLG